MKKIKNLGIMLASAAMIFGMTACGDDDEPFGGGSAVSVTVNGATFKVDRAYWSVDVVVNAVEEASPRDETTTWYTLALYNCDYPNIKDPWHSITILYHKDGIGDITTFADGTYKDFTVSLSILSSDDSKDRQYYGNSDDEGNDATLTISHDGGGLSLSVSAMNYTDGNCGNSYPGPAFSYSGSVKKLPESAK